MWRRLLGLALVALAMMGLAGGAEARLDIRVDLAAQRMTVTTPDGESFNWAVSSGREGFRTIRGSFRPTRLEKRWVSRKYGGAMPNAIFFRGGFAIHGTGEVGKLGRPASHGCIRLAPGNAARLFALVQKHGKGATRIAINGVAPDAGSQFAKAKPSERIRAAKAGSGKPKVAKPRGGSDRGGGDWASARGRLLERDGFFSTGPVHGGAALGFQPVGQPWDGWRLRR
jgi:hypothetical protein